MDGFINLYKDSGWTSHDCVAKLRRLLQTKKVGHGGTLDPAAKGVLPIAVGRATRLLQYLPTDKAYRAVVRFGLTTNTDDLAGEVLSQSPAGHLDRATIEAQLPNFQGTIEQVRCTAPFMLTASGSIASLAKAASTSRYPAVASPSTLFKRPTGHRVISLS